MAYPVAFPIARALSYPLAGSGDFLGTAQGTPGFVPSDFLGRKGTSHFDFIGGPSYWDGQTFATEAAVNAAVPITKTGNVRSPTPYILPTTNLISNGTFDTDIAGWTAQPSHGLATWDTQNLLLAGNSQSGPNAYQAVTVELGKGYAASSQGWLTVGGGACQTRVATNSTGGILAGVSPAVSSLTPVDLTAYFSPDGTPMYVLLYNGQASGTNTYRFDNVFVKECIPVKRMTNGQGGVLYRGTAPASIASTLPIMWLGGSPTAAARGAVWIEARTDMHAYLMATQNNVSLANIDLGALTASTDFEIEFQYGVNIVSGRLDANARAGVTGQIPGVPLVHIGKNNLGTLWTGIPKSVTFFPLGHEAADEIIIVGDSLAGYQPWANDAGARCIPPRKVTVLSYAGNGAAQVYDHVKPGGDNPVAAIPGWGKPTTAHAFVVGYNNQTQCLTVLPQYLPMFFALLPPYSLASTPSVPWALFNLPRGEAHNQYNIDPDTGIAGTVFTAFKTQNVNEITAYGHGTTLGGHIVEIDEILVAATDLGIPQDVIDAGHQIAASSTRDIQAAPAPHPNSTKGRLLWGNAFFDYMAAQGLTVLPWK